MGHVIPRGMVILGTRGEVQAIYLDVGANRCEVAYPEALLVRILTKNRETGGRSKQENQMERIVMRSLPFPSASTTSGAGVAVLT